MKETVWFCSCRRFASDESEGVAVVRTILEKSLYLVIMGQLRKDEGITNLGMGFSVGFLG